MLHLNFQLRTHMYVYVFKAGGSGTASTVLANPVRKIH